MSVQTGVVQPIDFYREAKLEVFRFLDENPDNPYSKLDFDSFLFAQDIQPFPISVAGIEVETIDIDVVKFIGGQQLCRKEEHSQIYFGMTGRYDGEIVRHLSRGRDHGGYMYLLCGGERLPTLVPLQSLRDRNPYVNGTELDTVQCARFMEILRGLAPLARSVTLPLKK